MNCQNFETLAPELARGALLDTAARDDARAHADSCRACAARLADERTLTAGLRAFAERERAAEAPARVESVLLASFRARATSADASAHEAVTRDVVTRDAQVNAHATARGLRWFPRWAQGAAVAAASALLVFGLYGLFVKREGVANTQDRAASAPPQSSSQSSQPAPNAAAQDSQDFTTSNAAAHDYDAGGEHNPTTASAIHAERMRRRAGGARPVEAKFGGSTAGASSSAKTAASQPLNTGAGDEAAEITTDFFPLVHDRLVPADSGHLVRVELPRAALARFGLPVNAERAGERVKADVLMGDDGIARAIRFVR